jgi:hypothetical protein
MTVVAKIPLSLGWIVRPQYRNNILNQRKTMNEVVDKFARVFGACVIIVSLCSGCATGTPPARPMTASDLDTFVPNCKIKDQQRAFLESMRLTPDDVFFNKINVFEEKYGDVNTRVNLFLFDLRYCP